MNVPHPHPSTKGMTPFVLVGLAALVGSGDLVVDYPAWLRDSLRVIVLVEAVSVFALSLVIALRYYRNFRADPTKARLLPRHVTLFGLGVALLCVAVSAGIISLIGRPFIWYITPTCLPAYTALTIGLFDMLRWLPDRTAPPDNSRRRDEDRPGHNEGLKR